MGMVLQRADVRVAEVRDALRLALESLAELWSVGQERRQDLDGDGPIQAGVGGAIHLSHATGANR